MIKNNLAIGRNWDQIGEILLRFTKEVLYSIQEFEDFTENGYDEGAEQDAEIEEANLEIEASELFELV